MKDDGKVVQIGTLYNVAFNQPDPKANDPRVTLSMPAEMLFWLDAWAATRSLSRAAAIRKIVQEELWEEQRREIDAATERRKSTDTTPNEG